MKYCCVEFDTGEVLVCQSGSCLKRVLRRTRYHSPMDGRIKRFFKVTRKEDHSEWVISKKSWPRRTR